MLGSARARPAANCWYAKKASTAAGRIQFCHEGRGGVGSAVGGTEGRGTLFEVGIGLSFL